MVPRGCGGSARRGHEFENHLRPRAVFDEETLRGGMILNDIDRARASSVPTGETDSLRARRNGILAQLRERSGRGYTVMMSR
jgi:hypothetical protein